jgi:hypothetical protein
MDRQGAGVFLPLEDCKAVFSRLKGLESILSAPERDVLWKLEKTLYQHLSIREVEKLLAPTPGDDPR